MDKVKLEMAHTWICWVCKNRNFGQLIETEEEVYADFPEEEEGSLVVCPETVLCSYCFSFFDVDEDGGIGVEV